MTDLTKILNNPEEHYPGNFDTPQRANALLTGLCQDAANEIERLNAEVLEQCRINGMSAEREDALRAELTRLKSSIALDKMAENARELGLDYEPAVQERNFCERCGKRLGGDGHIHTCTPPAAQPDVQEKCFLCGERVDSCASDVCPKSAQPAVQEGRDWSLLEATQESLREHMAEITRLKAAQPAPVKTYHDGKPWPVQPAPDPAPIIQQLVTALEGSGTRMRSDQRYIEIEAVAAGKFYLNSKGEGL
jgi:hypothetical protein